MKTSSGRALASLAAVCLLLVTTRPASAGHYTWTTSGPQPGMIYQIVVGSEDSSRIYTYAGFWGSILFQTSDGGATWHQNEGLLSPSTVVAHPNDGSILFAIGYSPDGVGGIFRTNDAGAVWFPANQGLSGPVSSMGLAASSPNILYAISAGSPGKVFRSDDGAGSWTTATSNFPSDYVADLAVDPQNPAVLYVVAGTGILKSVDSGATWNPGGSILNPECVRIDATSSSTIWAGSNSEGVYKSADGGATWNPASNGIGATWVRDIAIDPANPLKAFAAGDGGIFVTQDGGGLWSPVDLGVPVGSGMAVAIDPRDSALVYAAGGAGNLIGTFFRSDDGGQSWAVAQSGLSGGYSHSVAPNPSLVDEAYAVSGGKLFAGGAAGWTLRGQSASALTELLADPSQPDVLYAAFAGLLPATSGVVRSDDGGATWDPATDGLAVSTIHRLAMAPSDPSHLLAATQDGLFGTSNEGGLWSSLLAGDVRASAYDSADHGILYAGYFAQANQDGLLRSDNGGTTWSAPGGLPKAYLRVSDIACPVGEPSTVYVAATYSGLFRSLDRGLTFALAEIGLPAVDQIPYRLAPDPSDSRTLYLLMTYGGAAATEGTSSFAIYRTNDGADTWKPLPGFIPSLSTLDFRVNADGRILYASTLSGVFQFERSFLDVPDGDLFWTSVDAAAMNRLTAGCGGGSYCPGAAASRASIAVFLLRGKHGAAYEPPASTGQVFSDVPASTFAAAFIEELFREGITAGCEATTYCPSAPVSRAQLAVMLLKAKHGSDYVPPPATGTVFSDVPADAFAAAWIEQLSTEGIAAGCGGGQFCPDDATSRAQAAAFAMRAFGLS